jgi:hypothetical protein
MIRWLVAGAVVAALAALLSFGSDSFGAPDAPKLEPAFFRHADHAGYGAVVMTGDKKNCKACHGVDAKSGAVAVPGAVGHQPCLASGCHDTWYLSAGMPSDKNYVRAASFCLGCHDTPDSKPPKASSKPNALFRSFKAEIEFHVEMPGPTDPQPAEWNGRGSHFAHSDKTKMRTDCRSCHIVDQKGLLDESAPGHPQCQPCHTDPKHEHVKVAMEDCEGCHHEGKRVSPFDDQSSRHGKDNPDELKEPTTAQHATSVRSCSSEAFLNIAKKAKHPEKLPCFRHERPEHRFRDYSSATPKDAVQCDQCHFMVNDDKVWGNVGAKIGKKVQYFSLDDIHKFPIIANSMNEEHQACGAGQKGCHSRDIPSQGSGRCELCHAGQQTEAF